MKKTENIYSAFYRTKLKFP